jgi:hypothetical protein
MGEGRSHCRAVYDMNCLRSIKRWGLGFKSIARHGCLRLFCVRVGSGLPTGWFPVQGVLPLVVWLRNWSETKRFTNAYAPKWEHHERERERWGRGFQYNVVPWHFNEIALRGTAIVVPVTWFCSHTPWNSGIFHKSVFTKPWRNAREREREIIVLETVDVLFAIWKDKHDQHLECP